MNRFFIAIGLWLMATAFFSPSSLMAQERAKPAELSAYQPKVLDKAKGPNRILVIDNFDYPNMLNLMGGETQGDEEEPGGLIPSYTPSGRLTMGRIGHSLKMDYNVSIPMSIAYYWTRFGRPDHEVPIAGATMPLNLEGFNYLSFWIKTDLAHPRFSVEFHQDTNRDHLFILGQDVNTKIAVSSYILTTEEEISGISTEVIVSAEDSRFLVQPTIYIPADDEAEPTEIEEGDITGELPEDEELPSEGMIEVMPSADEIMYGPEETAAEPEKLEAPEEEEAVEVMPSAEEVMADEEAVVEPEQIEVPVEPEVPAEEEMIEVMPSAAEVMDEQPQAVSEEKPEKEEEKPEETVKPIDKEAALEKLEPVQKYKRRSRRRVTFFHTEGPFDSPEKEVARRKFERKVAKTPTKRTPVEVKVSSPLITQPVVTAVMGSGSKEVKTVRAPKHIRALRKEDIRWRKVVVPLDRFKGIKDWSSILEMVFVFDNRLGSDLGILYVDDIVFGTNYMYPKPTVPLRTRVESLKFAPIKQGVSAAVIRGIRMANRQEENQVLIEAAGAERPSEDVSNLLLEAKRNSREKLKRLFDMDKAQDFAADAQVPNFFLLVLDTEPVEPTLEALRLEISNDNGKTWSIVTSLFDHQPDGQYIFPWRLPSTRPGQSVRFRLTASDIWGRYIVVQEPFNFQVGKKA